MDFTDAYRLAASSSSSSSSSSHRPFAYSTGSTFFSTLHHLADTNTSVVQVRVSNSLQIVRTWTLDFHATSISWSKSGTLLLVVGKNEWIVLSVDPNAGHKTASELQGIVARVVAGMEGLASAIWIGSGSNEAVCAFSLDEVVAHIFDIKRHTVLSIANPKKSKVFANSTSHHTALLTRSNGKDAITILTSPSSRHTSEWSIEESFAIHTNDAVEAAWSPNDRFIAIREGMLEYKVHIYSPLGHLQAIFQLDSTSTLTRSLHQTVYRQMNLESAKIAGDGLGIREMKWNPSGSLLALGGYDEAVRILESSEWTVSICLDLSQKLVAQCQDGAMGSSIGWREPSDWRNDSAGRGIVAYDQLDMPFTVPSLRIDMSRPTRSKSGICWMEWNHSGTLLGVRNDNHPAALYIFAFPLVQKEAIDQRVQSYLLSIIMTSSAIVHACWKPAGNNSDRSKSSTLAFITLQSQSIHLWNQNTSRGGTQIVEVIPIPIDDFYPSDFAFAPDGNKMLITSQSDTYCCAIEAPESSLMEESHL